MDSREYESGLDPKDRPTEWEKAINDNFKIASSSYREGYQDVGKEDYHFPLMIRNKTTPTVDSYVARLLEKSPTIRVLDIGTGNGKFIYNLVTKFKGKVQVIGLTAYDMRYEKPEKSSSMAYMIFLAAKEALLSNPNDKAALSIVQQMDPEKDKQKHKKLQESGEAIYAIHNCEKLFSDPKLVAPGSFDLIVSSTTFMHLTDPAGALIQAYEALKEGGVLFIDKFTLQGLAEFPASNDGGTRLALGAVEYHKCLIDWLQKEGYKVEATYDTSKQNIFAPQAFECLCLQKTSGKPALVLPISYGEAPGTYVPTRALELFFANRDKDPLYEQRKEDYLQKVKDIEQVTEIKQKLGDFANKLKKVSLKILNCGPDEKEQCSQELYDLVKRGEIFKVAEGLIESDQEGVKKLLLKEAKECSQFANARYKGIDLNNFDKMLEYLIEDNDLLREVAFSEQGKYPFIAALIMTAVNALEAAPSLEQSASFQKLFSTLKVNASAAPKEIGKKEAVDRPTKVESANPKDTKGKGTKSESPEPEQGNKDGSNFTM